MIHDKSICMPGPREYDALTKRYQAKCGVWEKGLTDK
jgi:hypothetical protein